MVTMTTKPITELAILRITPTREKQSAIQQLLPPPVVYEITARRARKSQHIAYVVIKEPIHPARELSTIWDYVRSAIVQYETCARAQNGTLGL